MKRYEPKRKSIKHRSFLIDTTKFQAYVFNRITERDNYALYFGKKADILNSNFKNITVRREVKDAYLVLAYFCPEFLICELIRLNRDPSFL